MATLNIPGIKPSIGDLAYQLPIGVSYLGTPIIDDITFPKGKGSIYKNGRKLNISWQEFKLETVTLVLTQESNTVRTQVGGRNGTIKEYVNLSDYHISIIAKVNEALPIFPVDQIGTFTRLKTVQSAIPITSKFLTLFGIKKVVIDSYSINPIVGSTNECDLSIELSSDDDFDPTEYLL